MATTAKGLSRDHLNRLTDLIDRHVAAQVALAKAAGPAVISQCDVAAMVASSNLRRYLKGLGERQPEKDPP